jgi:hypothetical protein
MTRIAQIIGLQSEGSSIDDEQEAVSRPFIRGIRAIRGFLTPRYQFEYLTAIRHAQ